MAHRHRLGTSSAPIEIIDSGDEPEVPGSPAVIDLTQEDTEIQHPFSAFPPALSTRKKYLSKIETIASRSRSGQPRRRARQKVLSQKDSQTHLITEGETETSSLSRPRCQASSSSDSNIIGTYQRCVSEDDIDGEPSDTMDIPTHRRRRPRRERQHGHQTLGVPFPAIPPHLRRVCEKPSIEMVVAGARRVQSDRANRCEDTVSSSLSAIENILLSIKLKMGEGRAMYTNARLLSAMKTCNGLQNDLSDFSNHANPFKNMPSIEDNKNSVTKAKNQIDIVNMETNNVQNKQFNEPKRVPGHKQYITITRSMLVPDNQQLLFEQYLGHSIENDEVHQKSWLKRPKGLFDKPEDSQSSRQAEHVHRLKEYLPVMLDKLELTREAIVSYFINFDNTTSPSASEVSAMPVALFLIAFENIFATKIQEVIPEISERLSWLERPSAMPKLTEALSPVKKLLQTHLLSCPICHIHACGIHGVYESDNSDVEETDKTDRADKGYADMNMSYESMIDCYNEKAARSEPLGTNSIYEEGKCCGPYCFLAKDQNDRKSAVWATDETTYFQAMFLGMQNEPRAACILAPLMKRPCSDVHEYIASLLPEARKTPQRESRKKGKLDWYDNKRKRIRVDLDWGEKTNTHLHHKRCQPIGCEHPGLSCNQARKECSCFQDKILCDKFCACPGDCYMKFTGCDCPRSDTPCSQGSPSCPCVLLNRECDPDLCHTCGATEIVNPFTQAKDPPPQSCQNTAIQIGSRKRLLVDKSSHPANIGFGAFIAEPVARGAFIAEYVGEIISYAEAARRAETYNALKVSFLFDLNDEVAIDSFRYGNLERFINHSRARANCQPIVKLVNGEHRIGIFATADLAPGAELFFDYGEEFVRKHGLKEMVDGEPESGGVRKSASKRLKAS